ncbi:hypothetical protein APHAL10511_005153 [Amanita phalloides]|nr:hypothetical protein APHAL10511_005153 [Amanita phalloides]
MHFTPVLWIFVLLNAAVARREGELAPPTAKEVDGLQIGQIIMHYSQSQDKNRAPVPYFPVIFIGHEQQKGLKTGVLNFAILDFEAPPFIPPGSKSWKDFSHYFPDDAGKTEIEYRTRKFLLGGKISLVTMEIVPKYIRIPYPQLKRLNPEQAEKLRQDMLHYQNQNNHGEVKNQELSSSNANIQRRPIQGLLRNDPSSTQLVALTFNYSESTPFISKPFCTLDVDYECTLPSFIDI